MRKAQFFCRHCNLHTLHTESTVPFEHFPHFMLILFCCGTWLPVWLISWLLHDVFNPATWHCSVCGQRLDALTPQDMLVQQSQAAQYASQRAATSARRRAEIEAMTAGAMRWLSTAPGRFIGWYDGVLNRIFGEEYRLLYRFAQVFTAAAFACAVLGVLAWIVSYG